MSASTVHESNPTAGEPGAEGAKPPASVLPPCPEQASALTLAALARTDQRRRWAEGERLLAEVYLHAWAALQADPDAVLDLLHSEFLLRAEHGDALSLEEYRVRFPALAARLEARLRLQATLLGPAAEPGNPATLTDAPPNGPGTLSGGGDGVLATRAGAAIPSSVAGYRILGVLGRGGMGVVYKARQPGIDRIVALKMILAGAHASPTDLARFRLEAEAVGRLQHPNVVQIYEVGVHEGWPFLTLEFCGGGTLADLLDGTPLPARKAAELIRDLARGVEAAHRAGIVHRDLKPSNVLLALPPHPPAPSPTRGEGETDSAALPLPPTWGRGGLPGRGIKLGGGGEGTPKITDFGLAKRLGGDSSHTRTGAVLGTPSYMAPEQAAGHASKIGTAVDVYALGAILYELLTGRPPFKGATPADTVWQVLVEEPIPPRRLQPRATRELETIALKCLEKDPQKRYSAAADLAADLQRFLDNRPIRARPVGPLGRLGKWARRQPALAAMTALCIALAGVGLTLVSWKWWEATAQRGLAVAAQEKAEENERLARAAQARAEAGHYRHGIVLADRQWLAHNPDQARAVLDSLPTHLRNWEWGYLSNLCQGGLFTLRGHRGPASSLATSPDRRHLASGGQDGTIRLWTWEGTRVRKLSVPGQPVHGIAFSPNGKLLASAHGDGAVRLWDVNTGKPGVTLRGHEGPVADVAFSPDSAQLASGGEDEKVILWDLAKATPVRTLEGHTNTVSRVEYNPKGGQLASAGYDSAVIVWDPQTGRELFRCEGHKDGVTDLTFSPDGKVLASASGDRTAVLWETTAGQPLRVLRGHTEGLTGLAFSPDGARLVSGAADRTARVWDAGSGRELLTLCGHAGPVSAVTFSGDGRRVASAGGDGLIKVWDALAEPTAVTLRGEGGAVKEVAFSPDGKLIAEVRADGVLRVRDARSWRVLSSFSADCALPGVAFSPDGKLLACPASDRTIRVLDAAGRGELRRLTGHEGLITAVAFSPDAEGPSLLASAGHDETIRLWDPTTGRTARSLKGHKDSVRCLAFSRDGKRLASGSEDGAVLVWEVESGSVLASSPARPEAVSHLAFHPDGETLAVAGAGGALELRAAAGEATRLLRGHTGEVRGAVFSKDGTRLVSAGADGAVKIWDAESGHEVLPLRGHSAAVNCVTFNPDGTVLASGGEDQTLRLWSSLQTPDS